MLVLTACAEPLAEPDLTGIPLGALCDGRQCGELGDGISCGTCPGQLWCEQAVGQCVVGPLTVLANGQLADGAPLLLLPTLVSPGSVEGVFQVATQGQADAVSATFLTPDIGHWKLEPSSQTVSSGTPGAWMVERKSLQETSVIHQADPRVVLLRAEASGLTKRIRVQGPVAYADTQGELTPKEDLLWWPGPWEFAVTLSPPAYGLGAAIGQLWLSGPSGTTLELADPEADAPVVLTAGKAQVFDPPWVFWETVTGRLVVPTLDHAPDWPKAGKLSVMIETVGIMGHVETHGFHTSVHQTGCYAAIEDGAVGSRVLTGPPQWLVRTEAASKLSLNGQLAGPLANPDDGAELGWWEATWPNGTRTAIGDDLSQLNLRLLTVGTHEIHLHANGAGCLSDSLQVDVFAGAFLHIEVVAQHPTTVWIAWQHDKGSCAVPDTPCHTSPGWVWLYANEAAGYTPLVTRAAEGTNADLWIHASAPQTVEVRVWVPGQEAPTVTEWSIPEGATRLGHTTGDRDFHPGLP